MKRRKFIRKFERTTPKGKYKRIKIGRFIFGKNSHPFKQHSNVRHYHIGERIKYVREPKQLKGFWIKRKGGYERISKVVKEGFRRRIPRIRKGRGKKH